MRLPSPESVIEMTVDHVEDTHVEGGRATEERASRDIVEGDGTAALSGTEFTLFGSKLVSCRIDQIGAGFGR